MGICCSKKNHDIKSDIPIQKKPNPNPQIDKYPEEKTVAKEKPIIKPRKSSENELKSDEKISKSIQKKQNHTLKIDKIPEEKTEIKEKPIIKYGKKNKTELPFEEKASKPVQKNPNPNPQSDKNSEEKTQIKEKPIVKHRKSKEIDGRTNEETPKPDKKPISLVTNSITDSNLGSNSDEVEAILIQCGQLSHCSSAAQEDENTDVATTREGRRQSPNQRRTPGRKRVSRSPGKRSEMKCRDTIGRPGKMVYVPVMDKEGPTKRNVASPHRSRSPANRANSRVSGESFGQNGNTNSNRNSRKAERSPYRRNPLGEIDQNAVKNSLPQKQGIDNAKNSRTKTKQPTQAEERAKSHSQTTNNSAKNVIISGPEPLKTLTRTRSSRLSRDLDNLDTQNPTPPSSYTTLLLEDIQNFHNKNSISIPLPQCLSKTCSILDQIADLNSSKGTEGLTMEKYAKKLLENKEPPLLETEVVGMSDLVEPSFQKYVTVKRVDVEREEREESLGSNSFAGGPQHWISSSLWDTNSTGSTDYWATSSMSSTRNSRSNTKEDDGKKSEIDCYKMGIGQGKGDLRSGLHSRSAISTATI